MLRFKGTHIRVNDVKNLLKDGNINICIRDTYEYCLKKTHKRTYFYTISKDECKYYFSYTRTFFTSIKHTDWYINVILKGSKYTPSCMFTFYMSEFVPYY